VNATRRSIVTMASLLPAYALAGKSSVTVNGDNINKRLVLSDFGPRQEVLIPGARFRGFTDRVMGGVSNADFNRDEIDGRRCVRMTGNVTRDNGGGFVQVALYLDDTDASGYKGVELLLYGNDEDYNAHIRTADCGWHDESYRATFHAESRWQTVQIPWATFKPNGVTAAMDTTRLERLGLLGWMREFSADLAIGEIALYS
jgi:hypothetical protein